LPRPAACLLEGLVVCRLHELGTNRFVFLLFFTGRAGFLLDGQEAISQGALLRTQSVNGVFGFGRDFANGGDFV